MNIWYLLTLAGEPMLWLLITGLLPLCYISLIRKKIPKERRRQIKKTITVLVFSVWIASGMVLFIKTAWHTKRPCTPCSISPTCNPLCQGNSSFPSGHASIAFAVFTSLYLGFRDKKMSLLIFLIPSLIALSRYFLGLHYLVDIFAGCILGIAVSLAVFGVYEKKFGY